MKQWWQYYSRWIVLLILPILSGTGCLGSGEVTPTPTPPLQVDLTAANIIVERLRQGTDPYVLQKDEVVSDIQMNDLISVKEHGRGLLRFSDSLLVELFRDTDALVPAVHLEPSGFILARLKQIFGHTRTRLESVAKARVTVETDYATITTLVNNTEIVVCHAPELTCMVTLSGEAEVEAQGQVVGVPAGTGTYIFPGKPPQPAICANLAEVRSWLDKKRSLEEVGPLGALVVGWPQEPCPEVSQQPSPSPESSPTSAPTSTPGPIPPPTSSPIPTTPPPTSAQPLCMVVTQVLNLRHGPGFSYWPPITTLLTGMQLDPLVRTFDGQWIQVRVRESGQIGWVAAKPTCISCNVLVADLPVSQ